MRKQKGFSLIELLIVVAIILIIAAIAIPNLLAARKAANESAGAGTVRTLNTAEVTYATAYASQGFANTLAQLGPSANCADPTQVTSTNACLIDNVLASGTKGAYVYAITSTASSTPYGDFLITATPVNVILAGKDFCALTDVVVRFQKDPKSSGAGTTFSGTTCAAATAIQ